LGQSRGEGWWCRPWPILRRKERERGEEKERGKSPLLSLGQLKREKGERRKKGQGYEKRGPCRSACAIFLKKSANAHVLAKLQEGK
jgi:hypothetical protein